MTVEKFSYPYSERGNFNRMIKDRVIDRSFDLYLQYFGLEEKKLAGKKILDVGSAAANFVKEAQAKGINAVALDPMYSFKRGRDILKKTGGHDKRHPIRAVAAVAEELPFKDRSFDMVFNLFSAFFYCRTPEDLEKIMKEELRMLKRGGEIFIPVADYGIFYALLTDSDFPHELEVSLRKRFDELLEEITATGDYKVTLQTKGRTPFVSIRKNDEVSANE